MFVQVALRCLTLLVLVVRAAPCRAEPCNVEVGSLTPEWQEAAQRLRQLGLTHADCARLHLEPIDAGVRVTFVTYDGRQAERLVTAPSELHPTVEALLVTGDGPRREAPENARPAPTTTAPERTVSAAPPQSPPGELSLAISLQAGARAGAESLASPLVAGGMAVLLGPWEIGVLGAYEFNYARLAGDTSSDRGARALALAVSAGRREPVGAASFFAGARAYVAALEYRDVQDDSHAEGRAGAYAGVTWPAREPWRLRADLAADWVIAGAFQSDGPAGVAPPSITPPWAVTALVGVETDAL